MQYLVKRHLLTAPVPCIQLLVSLVPARFPKNFYLPGLGDETGDADRVQIPMDANGNPNYRVDSTGNSDWLQEWKDYLAAGLADEVKEDPHAPMTPPADIEGPAGKTPYATSDDESWDGDWWPRDLDSSQIGGRYFSRATRADSDILDSELDGEECS